MTGSMCVICICLVQHESSSKRWTNRERLSRPDWPKCQSVLGPSFGAWAAAASVSLQIVNNVHKALISLPFCGRVSSQRQFTCPPFAAIQLWATLFVNCSQIQQTAITLWFWQVAKSLALRMRFASVASGIETVTNLNWNCIKNCAAHMTRMQFIFDFDWNFDSALGNMNKTKQKNTRAWA